MQEHMHDWDMDNASCTFGCGAVVDSDTGICPKCREHSNNVVECSECGDLADIDPFTNEITERSAMSTYYVEVWENGSEYEAGKSGLLLAVRATSVAHAEEVAMRSGEFEVAEAR